MAGAADRAQADGVAEAQACPGPVCDRTHADVRPDLKRPGICELDAQVVDFVKTQRAAAQPAAALDLFCANGSIPQVIAKTC